MTVTVDSFLILLRSHGHGSHGSTVQVDDKVANHNTMPQRHGAHGHGMLSSIPATKKGKRNISPRHMHVHYCTATLHVLLEAAHVANKKYDAAVATFANAFSTCSRSNTANASELPLYSNGRCNVCKRVGRFK